jgi:hypothetical protein
MLLYLKFRPREYHKASTGILVVAFDKADVYASHYC